MILLLWSWVLYFVEGHISQENILFWYIFRCLIQIIYCQFKPLGFLVFAIWLLKLCLCELKMLTKGELKLRDDTWQVVENQKMYLLRFSCCPTSLSLIFCSSQLYFGNSWWILFFVFSKSISNAKPTETLWKILVNAS